MDKQCALCLTSAKLYRSHIIPEFLCKALYDDEHRFHGLSSTIDQSNRKRQKGIWEWLLCGKCEQKLSKLEGYASQILKGGIPLTVSQQGSIVVVNRVKNPPAKQVALG